MLFQILEGPLLFLCAFDFTSDASKVSSSVLLILEIRLINKFSQNIKIRITRITVYSLLQQHKIRSLRR